MKRFCNQDGCSVNTRTGEEVNVIELKIRNNILHLGTVDFQLISVKTAKFEDDHLTNGSWYC